MSILRMGVLLGILMVESLPASALNYSGKWVFEVPGRGRQMQRITLILNQVGNEVDGTISSGVDAGSGSPSNSEILDGKVEKDILTFYVWTGRDRPVKAYYKGTLSGEEIKFTVTGGARMGSSSDQGGSQQFTAKRAK